MSRTLQFRRYANTTVATTTGADGELIIDETNHTITVHDGVTVGGTRLATETALFTNLATTNGNIYNVSNFASQISANTVALQNKTNNVATFNVDGSGNAISLKGNNGLPAGNYLTAVSSSRAITTSDFETVLSCASGITITIPSDATLGISGSTYAPTVCLMWSGTSQFVLAAASGVTINGGIPALVQYGSLGIIRTGSNTWAYL